MKTITKKIDLYKFKELSEKAQDNALSHFVDIDHEWWDYIYENAETVGITINGFDIDRGQDISLSVQYFDTTAEMILEHHGEQTETYKLAKTFLSDFKKTCEQIEIAVENDTPNHDDLLDKKEYLVDMFSNELGECYLQMLEREHEYLTSREALTETIEANDYDFLITGELY